MWTDGGLLSRLVYSEAPDVGQVETAEDSEARQYRVHNSREILDCSQGLVTMVTTGVCLTPSQQRQAYRNAD